MRSYKRQRGMTFVVVMVMMVMMTMFVISAINLSNINLKIVFNMQQQRENEAIAQQAIERIVSAAENFSYTPTSMDICKNGSVVAPTGCGLTNPKIGLVEAPTCIFNKPKEGYSKKLEEMPIEETTWEVRSTVENTTTGASVHIRQGILISLLADNCPP